MWLCDRCFREIAERRERVEDALPSGFLRKNFTKCQRSCDYCHENDACSDIQIGGMRPSPSAAAREKARREASVYDGPLDRIEKILDGDGVDDVPPIVNPPPPKRKAAKAPVTSAEPWCGRCGRVGHTRRNCDWDPS